MFITELYNFMPEKIYLYILRVLIFIIIIFLTKVITKFTSKSFCKFFESWRGDKTFLLFLESILLFIIRVFGFVLGLYSLGFNIQTFLTFFGALGITLSVALRDSISSLGSGFIILFSGNFKTGDKIKIQEEVGIIKEIQLMQTIVKTENGNLIIPNNYLVNNIIRKF